MKQVTATEARRNWFRLLDEAAAGEVVVLHRRGHRLVLRREDPEVPDYSGLIQVDDLGDADHWGWQLTPHSGG